MMASAAALGGREVSAEARRFARTAITAVALVTPLWLWTACDLWSGRFVFDRYLPYEANFFDLQGRAMLHGHLYLADGAVGIEAFLHGGHQYTYFGLFPSLIRLPILALTSSFDAHLTVPSMLLAWLVTALFSALLVWRVRCQLRGEAPLGWAEAASLGAFVATVCAGSVLVYLAATPFVFDEDLAWSVALSLVSFFLLLGVLERPSGRRVLWCGVVIAAANLDRVTTGVGCAAGALLLAGWLALGRGRAGHPARRFALPMAFAGAAPLLIAAAVNFAKFGQLFGLPMQDQVFSHINAYRERFLAANGGEVGVQFVPSNLLAYLRPDALHFTTLFPFITLPTSPAGVVGNVLFDRTYPTTSVTASMPLLFLAACFGLFSCLRRRPASPAARCIGLLSIAAGVSAGAILLWGYIADRYLADFLPVLVMAGAVGVIELWRLLSGRARRARLGATAAVGALAVFGVFVNGTISLTPTDEWSTTQASNFVNAQASLASTTGSGLSGSVAHGSRLPAWAPAGTLFDLGRCDALYVSNGENFSTIPLERYQHATWIAADEGLPYRHELRLRFGTRQAATNGSLVPLLRSGLSSVSVETSAGTRPGLRSVQFVVADPYHPVSSLLATVSAGSTKDITVITDLQQHKVILTMDGTMYVDSVFSGGSRVAIARGQSATASVTVADISDGADESALCRRVTSSG